MDKVAELLKTLQEKDRVEVIKNKLNSGELSFDDIAIYNANDNPTKLYFCPTCDNISELDKPNDYHGTHIVCFECETFF